MLLARLKAGGHKCLIFTQMSRMLDVLEVGGAAELGSLAALVVSTAKALLARRLQLSPTALAVHPRPTLPRLPHPPPTRPSSTCTRTRTCAWTAPPSRSSAKS